MSHPQFSTLVAAVSKAGLVDALKAEGPFTIFAPTNAAFDALFAQLQVNGIADLTAEQLTPILLYLVLSGNVRAADVKRKIFQINIYFPIRLKAPLAPFFILPTERNFLYLQIKIKQ